MITFVISSWMVPVLGTAAFALAFLAYIFLSEWKIKLRIARMRAASWQSIASGYEDELDAQDKRLENLANAAEQTKETMQYTQRIVLEAIPVVAQATERILELELMVADRDDEIATSNYHGQNLLNAHAALQKKNDELHEVLRHMDNAGRTVTKRAIELFVMNELSKDAALEAVDVIENLQAKNADLKMRLNIQMANTRLLSSKLGSLVAEENARESDQDIDEDKLRQLGTRKSLKSSRKK